jgi:hypothetical protein
MERSLAAGECVDVSACLRTTAGDYILEGDMIPDPESDMPDYCNAETEGWIWSIGRHVETGVVVASHSAKLYQNPAYECLWLR